MQYIHDDSLDGSNVWIDFRDICGKEVFPAAISTAGAICHNNGERYHLTSRDFLRFTRKGYHILQYTEQGLGQISYRFPDGHTATYDLPPGRCFFITHDDEFNFHSPGDCQWSYIYIGFRGELASRIFGQIRQGEPVRRLRDTSACVTQFRQLIHQALRTSMTSTDVRKAACSILLDLEKELSDDELAGLDSLQREATEFVRNNLSCIDVRKMASHFKLAEKYFQAYFKAQCGITPGRFIMEQRLIHAVHLLECTNMKLNAIAELSGFADASHLCRTFKRSIGMTAQSYRENGGNACRAIYGQMISKGLRPDGAS